jgi:hypothetical protein
MPLTTPRRSLKPRHASHGRRRSLDPGTRPQKHHTSNPEKHRSHVISEHANDIIIPINTEGCLSATRPRARLDEHRDVSLAVDGWRQGAVGFIECRLLPHDEATSGGGPSRLEGHD